MKKKQTKKSLLLYLADLYVYIRYPEESSFYSFQNRSLNEISLQVPQSYWVLLN